MDRNKNVPPEWSLTQFLQLLRPFRPGALQIPSAKIVLEEQQLKGAELRGKRPLKGRAAKATHCNTMW